MDLMHKEFHPNWKPIIYTFIWIGFSWFVMSRFGFPSRFSIIGFLGLPLYIPTLILKLIPFPLHNPFSGILLVGTYCVLVFFFSYSIVVAVSKFIRKWNISQKVVVYYLLLFLLSVFWVMFTGGLFFIDGTISLSGYAILWTVGFPYSVSLWLFHTSDPFIPIIISSIILFVITTPVRKKYLE